MLLKILCLIPFVATQIFVDGFSRSIDIDYNPDFPSNCTKEGLHLVYARAVSNSNKHDVLHYVVTAGKVGPPAVMVISTSGVGAKLVFNCSNILSKNLEDRQKGIKLISGIKKFSAAFLVSHLWQYNDTNDNANMTHGNFSPPYPMDRFVWNINSAHDINKTSTILLTTNQTLNPEFFYQSDEKALEEDLFVSNYTTDAPTTAKPTKEPSPSHNLFGNGGKLSLKIVLSGQETRRDEQPRLYFTGNSTQLDLTLNSLSSPHSGVRYGLSLIQLSSLAKKQAIIRVNESRSIDDEFTPGIFKMINWMSYPESYDPQSEMHDRAFLQWKPVCYTSADRILSASQQMFYYKSKNFSKAYDEIMRSSVAFPWFQDGSTVFKAHALNISFGQSQDGFYQKSKFTEWSSSIGLGSPPSDEVSLLVILIISIGLGLPFILIVAGFITVLVRRRRSASERSAVYPVIN